MSVSHDETRRLSDEICLIFKVVLVDLRSGAMLLLPVVISALAVLPVMLGQQEPQYELFVMKRMRFVVIFIFCVVSFAVHKQRRVVLSQITSSCL